MAILVSCSSCGKSARVATRYKGQNVACIDCGKSTVVEGATVPDYDVFISYSSKDKNIADAICAALEQKRIPCWIAPRDVPPGSQWGAAIIDAIVGSRMMVVVYTSNSNQSGQVVREISTAVEKGKIIVPFRADDTPMSKDMEYLLKPLHWLDALTPPLESHIQRLVARAEAILSEDKEHIPPTIISKTTALPPQDSTMQREKSRARVYGYLALGIVLVVIAIALASRSLLLRKSATTAKILQETVSTQAPNSVNSGLEPENRPHIAVLPNNTQIDFVWIPPGTFAMGSPENEFGRNENELLHTVTISKGFWMGKYEVTQLQWEGVMQSNPSRIVSPHNPVENVSWMDAQEFIQRLNRSQDGEYRLPTEAEWEYACRAGSTTAYYFGDDSSVLGDYAWFNGNSTTRHPVGQRLPNAWGLYDMLGNVWEWCNDCYGEFSAEPVTDPQGAPVGDRVSRGGSWFISADQCRSAKREGTRPNLTHVSRGFRIVWTRN